MKVLIFSITVVICTVNVSLKAQKDAPIVYDAAKLIDILKKDYYVLDPDLREEELIRDRALVKSTYKTYLDDSTFNVTPNLKIDSLYRRYQKAKTAVNAFQALNFNLNGSSDTLIEKIVSRAEILSDTLAMAKTKYHTALFLRDSIELTVLASSVESNSKVLQEVINKHIQKFSAIRLASIDPFSSSNYASSIQKSIPFIGGDLAFETVVDGLSRFIAQRIKDELTTYVIEEIKIWLDQQSEFSIFRDLEILLPKTTDYFSKMRADDVSSLGNSFKQYVEDDLQNLISNASKLRFTPRFSRLIESYPEIDFAFEALEIIPNLSNLKNPLDYFKLIENSRNIQRWREDQNPTKTNVANLLKMSSLIANSLSTVEDGQLRFAGMDFLGKYLADTDFYKLYLSFLSQTNKNYYNINFRHKDGTGAVQRLSLSILLDSLTNQSVKLTEQKELLERIILQTSKSAEAVFNYAQVIKKANKANSEISADTIYQFVENIISLFENVVQGSSDFVSHFSKHFLVEVNISNLKNSTAAYLEVSRHINSIFLSLHERKYVSAISKSLDLYTLFKRQGQEYELASLNERMSVLTKAADNTKLKIWRKVYTADSLSDSEIGELSADVDSIISLLNRSIPNIKQPASIDLIQRHLESNTLSQISDNITFKNDTSFQVLLVSLSLENRRKGIGRNTLQDIASWNVDKSDLNEMYSSFVKYALAISPEEDGDSRTSLLNRRDSIIASIRLEMAKGKKDSITKYVHFINDIALSENAEDIKSAFDAFALPAGSYISKRKAIRDISINTFPGIVAGLDLPTKQRGKPMLSFTVPVGINLSWGSIDGISHGVFLPILDIGAITRLHLDSESNTSTLPEFNFQNILSPGLYYSWGLKENPLSLYGGFQFGPELKKINDQGNAEFLETFRIGIGAVLDIPLFTIHNKPRFNIP